jgi:hypothetical protein
MYFDSLASVTRADTVGQLLTVIKNPKHFVRAHTRFALKKIIFLLNFARALTNAFMLVDPR